MSPQITVRNNIPEDWPSTSNGISIHWHGFSMRNFSWYDGTSYVAQCPIPRGSSFTYRFQAWRAACCAVAEGANVNLSWDNMMHHDV